LITLRQAATTSLSAAAGYFSIGLESLALLGWYRNVPILYQIFPALPPIAPRTALTLVVAGLVLLGLEISASHPRVKILCLIGACLVILSEVLSLGQLAGIWSRDIDATLDRVVTGAVMPSPVPSALLATVAALLLGCALFAIASGVRFEPYLSQAFCLVAGAIGLGTLYAYAYSTTVVSNPAVASPFVGVTLPAALGYVALGLGILAREPRRGFLGIITNQGPARAYARLLVVLSLAAPLVLGAIIMVGVRFGLYDVPTAVAFAGVSSTLVLGLLALVVGRALNRLDDVVSASLRIVRSSVHADPNEMLQTIVTETQTVGAADYVALGLVADPQRPFDPWVFRGISPEQASAIGHFPRPVGLLGTVVTTGETVRLGDLTRDSRFRGFPPNHPPMHAFLGAPVCFHDRSVGNLYLTRQAGDVSFNIDDERAVDVLAAHAGAILEDRRLRAILAEEQSRLQAVLDTAPVGIVFVEADTDRVVANTWASRVFGRPIVPEAGRTQYAQRLLDPQGQPVPLETLPSSQALRGDIVETADLLYGRPDGSRMAIRESAAPLCDARGHVTGAVFVIEDVSAQRQLERERTEWTAVITHDLRQPVTTILGYATLLHRHLERLGASDHDRRAAEHIVTSAENLNRMIGDLLDVSRIESRRLTIRRQAIELLVLVREVLDRTQQVTAGHPVQLEVGEGIPLVEVDPARIEQVLGNLLSNAAKYSEGAAPIGLRIERRADTVEVSVSNVGPGIPPDELPQLFERFYRTRVARAGGPSGIGLGLYIAKGLVEAHGGRIWAESIPGQITTFHFTLPVPN
jgi:signal transduction histidine kinase